MKSYSESYKAAGVDVTAGYKAVELMKSHVARTKTAASFDEIGGFGGMISLDLTGIPNPVLVSGTDGVGTKLKIAFLMDKHDTVGIDCVAMCVNDVICCGARPLFFLDYVAVGKTCPKRSLPSSPALLRAACNPAPLSSAERLRKCPASTRLMNMISPGSASGSWTKAGSWILLYSKPAMY